MTIACVHRDLVEPTSGSAQGSRITHVLSRYGKAAIWLLALLASTAEVQAQSPSLSSMEAHALARRGKLLIIDVRSPVEWSRTGVPVGAKMIDKDLPLDKLIEAIDRITRKHKTKRLAIICSVGVKSSEVRANLEVAGYRRVTDILDGVDGNANGPGWLASRLPMQPWPLR